MRVCLLRQEVGPITLWSSVEASGQVRLFKWKLFEIKFEIQFLSLSHFPGAQEPRLADGCNTRRHKDRMFSIITEGSVGQS